MTIVLHHHPYSRASSVVWMLEEVGAPYELRWVDIMKGGQKTTEFLARNPMGKLPVIEDGDTVVTETAAIGLYLGDRYSSGKLAPAVDDPARGPYLRWALFSPSVLEPACAAKPSGGEFNAGAVGWGTYETMLGATEHAIGKGPWLLGERFSMADTILGSTLRFMLQFKMIEPLPAFSAYVARIEQRPAFQRAVARNGAVMAEHGLGG